MNPPNQPYLCEIFMSALYSQVHLLTTYSIWPLQFMTTGTLYLCIIFILLFVTCFRALLCNITSIESGFAGHLDQLLFQFLSNIHQVWICFHDLILAYIRALCLVRFLRMEIFIQMMRHHLKYLDFKFRLNRLNHLDTRRD